MVRISDARMSGTAYGTVVLHVSPEAAIGGPLALVRDGDRVRLDAVAGVLDLLVTDGELARRRSQWRPATKPPTGWRRLSADHVHQANEGADLDIWDPAAVPPEGTPAYRAANHPPESPPVRDPIESAEE